MPERGGRSLVWFLARVIAGQQLSTVAARSIWARVEIAVKANGNSMPEFFRAKNARRLRRCGLSNAKVKALLAIRQAHAAGALSVGRLRKMNHAARAEHLQEIWGIGQWTADMTSIFYFGDRDVWPAGDMGVIRGLEKLIGKRSPATTLRIANSFSPYRSLLALYMWKVLDESKPTKKKTLPSQKQPV